MEEYRAKNLLITGGCGFIGSNVVNYLIDKYQDIKIVNVDILDYCADRKNVEIEEGEKYKLYVCSITDKVKILNILIENKIDTVMHLAAQTHVDNSFGNSLIFTETNTMGTHVLLECCRIYGGIKRFIHMSTDEVYGEILEGKCSTSSLLNPTNPYAASKAGAEFIVNSYRISYGMPTIITRGNNVYGPRQYPEKLIPKFILHLLNNKKCPVHGEGKSRRNFIYVNDVARALDIIMTKGEIGEIYNIGTDCEKSVLDILDILIPALHKDPSLSWISFATDRLFNDKRYAIDSSNLRSLGWSELTSLEEGMSSTIDWYTSKRSSYSISYN